MLLCDFSALGQHQTGISFVYSEVGVERIGHFLCLYFCCEQHAHTLLILVSFFQSLVMNNDSLPFLVILNLLMD